jgi:hypothetical protein
MEPFPFFVIARSNATRQSTPSLFCHCEEQRDAAIQPNRNFVIRNYDPDWIATSPRRPFRALLAMTRQILDKPGI